MDFFGSLGFGRLIRTVIPGFMNHLSLCLCIDAAAIAFVGKQLVGPFLLSEPAIFAALAIPFSILLGVLSNSVMFAFGIKSLLKSHHRATQTEFVAFDTSVKEYLRVQVADRLCLPPDIRKTMLAHADPAALIQEDNDVSPTDATRSEYWSFIEFQLNIMLTLCFSYLAAVFFALSVASFVVFPEGITKAHYFRHVVIGFVVAFFIVCVVSAILLSAARKNYKIFREKATSALLGSMLKRAMTHGHVTAGSAPEPAHDGAPPPSTAAPTP